MSEIIAVKELVEIYSDGTKAVDDISFNVKEGEFFGFLGPNGAGKSTTIKILTTLLRKTSDSVFVAGYDLDKEPGEIRKIIGVQSQETAVDGDLTGRENLALQGHFLGMPTQTIKKRTEELLKLLELENFADKRARNYSGGMKKRLDLATALIHQPKLIFLDEPTTGLDPQSRAAIWAYLERLNREEGITIFLTTQYMEEADRLCRQLSIIIVVSGSPRELKAQVGEDSIILSLEDCDKIKPQAKNVLNKIRGIGQIFDEGECLTVYAKNAGEIVADIVRAFDTNEIKLSSVSFSTPTLDDIFLRHTGRRIRPEELVKAPSRMLGARR